SPDPKWFEFHLRNQGPDIKLTPFAFFRGRFEEDRPISLSYTELVKVEIRQTVRGERRWKVQRGESLPYEIEDQLSKHPHEGYFHTGRNLKYTLRITNQSDRSLDAWVSGELAGSTFSTPLHLEPGEPDESIIQEVMARSFKPEKAETLTVKVNEGDR